MSSEKHVDGDNETATPSTEKTDEHDETQSRSSESGNDDTDSNASSEYEVEKILAKRRRRRGGYEYFIKWVGYDNSANEWIPESSLNCPQRVAEFEREEARKRKRTRKERERTYSQKRRNNNKRSKKRRVKVIEDDDNDGNDDDEQEPTKSVESSTGSTTNSDKDQEKNLITYGVEKGYQVQAILGINRTKGDQLHYLVHYKSPTMFDDNMELIPANVAKKYCEDELIQFYETRITWNDRPND
ncbi:unnamed protein product [Rotaria sordida]|uniref:Chromo domain-containing protein n=1 Tax=Rotaria sordida TaxID=392033 RepID=A0A813YJQ5_9BILA|nr:unnamed protein product [Rotaria sordida]CAF3609477.1 unnamed protein product [Rotaria sordida]